MKFTDDPDVKDTLGFLMTREITHFQQFEAALETIEPNFPPGQLQEDSRYGNLYFDMSKGKDFEGPWNQGNSTRTNETWNKIENVQDFVVSSDGLKTVKSEGAAMTMNEARKMSDRLSKERGKEISSAAPKKDIQWSEYKLEEMTI